MNDLITQQLAHKYGTDKYKDAILKKNKKQIVAKGKKEFIVLSRHILTKINENAVKHIYSKNINTVIDDIISNAKSHNLSLSQNTDLQNLLDKWEEVIKTATNINNNAKLVEAFTIVATNINNNANHGIESSLKRTLGISVFLAGYQNNNNLIVSSWIKDNILLFNQTKEFMGNSLLTNISRKIRIGTTNKELNEIVSNIFGKTKIKAQNIGFDQAHKLYGEINLDTQESIGIEQYMWVTMGDDRVRESHEELHGTIRTKDDGIIPGEEINCRCYAEPVININAL